MRSYRAVMRLVGLTIACIGPVLAIIMCAAGLKLSITMMLIATFVVVGAAMVISTGWDEDR